MRKVDTVSLLHSPHIPIGSPQRIFVQAEVKVLDDTDRGRLLALQNPNSNKLFFTSCAGLMRPESLQPVFTPAKIARVISLEAAEFSTKTLGDCGFISILGDTPGVGQLKSALSSPLPLTFYNPIQLVFDSPFGGEFDPPYLKAETLKSATDVAVGIGASVTVRFGNFSGLGDELLAKMKKAKKKKSLS